MPKAKPYFGPVDDDLGRQILNSTGEKRDLNGEKLFLGDALYKTVEELKHLVKQANTAMKGNEFAGIVAENLANKLNRRGVAEIFVNDSGEVQLLVRYDDSPVPSSVSKRHRNVPLMSELKEQAKRLGVEIPKEFGIKRTKIAAYLNELEAQRKNSSSKKKAASSDKDPGPMSAGPDEVRVSPLPDDPKPPKKRGFVKTSEALTGPVVVDAGPTKDASNETSAPKPRDSQPDRSSRPNLRQLVKDSKDVDIADLLTAEPPKQ